MKVWKWLVVFLLFFACLTYTGCYKYVSADVAYKYSEAANIPVNIGFWSIFVGGMAFFTKHFKISILCLIVLILA